jgi:hypothetical protein
MRIAAAALLGVVLFWTYGDRPLVGEPWQWADDGLYLRRAEGFVRWLHGDVKQWLGPYDALILVKAPLFSVWLGMLHVVHVPLRLAEFALLLWLPWLFRAAVRPVLALSWWQLGVIAIVLIALPFLPDEQRLLRSALQAALVSACLISVTGLLLRARGPDAEMGWWAVSSGLFFGLSYLNREETVWLVPPVASALFAVLVSAWWHRSWYRALRVTVCVVVAFAVPVGLTSALNYQSYGVFITAVPRAPAFTRAHQAMTRLEPESRERYVPIRTATRLKAYAISPAFAMLRPYLEGPASDSLASNPGHLSLNGRRPGTREFFVSTFEFALCEAAFQAGARTGADSEALFGRIAGELEAAIAAGKIGAGGGGPATLAAPLRGDYRRILKQTMVSLRLLYTLDSMTWPAAGTSSGTPQDLQRMENLTEMTTAPTQALKAVDLPDVGAETRVDLYHAITKIEMAAYAVGTVAFLAFAVAVAAGRWRNAACLEQALAGLVLSGSLVAFSLSMAVVDVLGFPILRRGGSYNDLGYAPLSVLCAFGLVILFSSLPRSHRILDTGAPSPTGSIPRNAP